MEKKSYLFVHLNKGVVVGFDTVLITNFKMPKTDTEYMEKLQAVGRSIAALRGFDDSAFCSCIELKKLSDTNYVELIEELEEIQTSMMIR